MQVDIDKAIEIEEKLFGDCFETSEQIDGMQNFLKKSKKPKNLKQPAKKETTEVAELPKGELRLTNLFVNKMKLLNKDLIIPKMPSILSSGDKEHYNSMTIAWVQLVLAMLDQYLQFMLNQKDIHINLLIKVLCLQFLILMKNYIKVNLGLMDQNQEEI